MIYDLIEVALSSGMRSGELRGLCWSDRDIKENLIHVRNSLNYLNSDYHLDSPKTASSVRDIPMLDNVVSIFRKRKKR